MCFRNVPNCYDGKKIIELLETSGVGQYDFIYVPHDFKRLPNLVNLGYFFVNFVSHEVALAAQEKLNGYNQWSVESKKEINCKWADSTQGFKACVKRYKNCPVLHKAVPPECKPLILANGALVPLKSTKKNIKQPPSVFEKEDVKKKKDASADMPADDGSDGSASTIPPDERNEDSPTETGDADQSSHADSREEISLGLSDAGNICLDTEPRANCSKCEEPFTVFGRWRHHCRACGLVCCAECAPRAGYGWRAGLKQATGMTYKRLCKGCALEPQSIKITHHVKTKNTFIDIGSYGSYEPQAPNSYP
jgi:hypothetical protein